MLTLMLLLNNQNPSPANAAVLVPPPNFQTARGGGGRSGWSMKTKDLGPDGLEESGGVWT